MTFADYLARWGSGSGGRFVSRKEAANRRGRLKRAIPIMGGIELNDLERRHLWNLQKCCLGDGLSTSTANKVMVAMRALLRDAEAAEEIHPERRRYLVSGIHKLREASNPTFEPWTLEERDLIIETYEEQLPHFAPMVRLLFFTGMRPEELLGLQWKDVDFPGQLIRIRRARVGAGNVMELTNCKTVEAPREIPLSDPAWDALMRLPLGEPEDFIVLGPRGKPLDWGNFTNRQHAYVMDLLDGLITRRVAYSARHTFITHALQSGAMDEFEVAWYCGTSTACIKKNYLKHTSEFRARMKKINLAVTPPKQDKNTRRKRKGHLRLVKG